MLARSRILQVQILIFCPQSAYIPLVVNIYSWKTIKYENLFGLHANQCAYTDPRDLDVDICISAL